MKYHKIYLIFIVFILVPIKGISQGCCSGGGNNPLAGGASSGVLNKGQMELAINHVYAETKRFFEKDATTDPYFKKLHSNYLYFRTDYGLTEKLTLSGGIGYYANRTIHEFKPEITKDLKQISSKGLADVIFLPRYKAYSKIDKGVSHELDLGVGFKLPIGKYNDSNLIGYSYFINNNGQQNFIDSNKIYQMNPPLVQPTLGSIDLMLSMFYMRTNKNSKLNIFLNGMYIRRGWSPLGIKFGDFASIGLFAGTNINKVGILAQIRGEFLGKMKTHEEVDYLAKYNIDQVSTGSKSIMFSPQLSYTLKGKTRIFLLGDFPLYQYVNGTQVAIPYQITSGITYRFFPNKKDALCAIPNLNVDCTPPTCLYVESSFKVAGICDMCKAKIEQILQAQAAVFSANWELKTQLVTVGFDSAKVNVNDLKQKLAEVGYDTDTHQSKDIIYNELPACCKYRK